MKIQYLLDESGTRYIEYHLNLESKELVFKVVEGKLTLQKETLDVTSVLAIVSNTNPRVEVVKKEKLWAFHLYKLDALGKTHQKTLETTTKDVLVPINVQLINDSTKDITLKNYSVHPLSIYPSSDDETVKG